MKLSITATLSALLAVASAVAIEAPDATAARREVLALEARQVNANRPVPTGACCVAATSLKQDVCSNNGQSGRCVPDSINGCGGQLTCIEDSRLTCDPNTLERGRPFCRRTGA